MSRVEQYFSVLYLMVATDEVHILGVLDLEGQEQADGLQGVGPSVHIVPQEQVVDVGDVACRAGHAVLLEQPHQVPKLAVKITKQLDGSCRALPA